MMNQNKHLDHSEQVGKENNVIPLSLVEVGKIVRLVNVTAGRELKARLAAMGLVPGVEMKMLNNANGKGPYIVAIKDCRVALGRGMSQKILVK